MLHEKAFSIELVLRVKTLSRKLSQSKQIIYSSSISTFYFVKTLWGGMNYEFSDRESIFHFLAFFLLRNDSKKCRSSCYWSFEEQFHFKIQISNPFHPKESKLRKLDSKETKKCFPNIYLPTYQINIYYLYRKANNEDDSFPTCLLEC